MSYTYYTLSKKVVDELYENYKRDYAEWKKELDETKGRWRPSKCTCIIAEAVEYKDVVLQDCRYCLRMMWVGDCGEEAYALLNSLLDKDPQETDICDIVRKKAMWYTPALFPYCRHCNRPSSFLSLAQKTTKMVERDHECPGC